jgi:uncharacterized protein
MNKSLIGKGWSFPVRVDGRGGIGLSAESSELDQSIQVILGTRIGERVMRPDFGCRIHDLVFSPINAETLSLAKRYVEEALGWWEPRIEVQEIEVASDASQKSLGKLIITVHYRVRATKDERSLVYPFYLIEERE